MYDYRNILNKHYVIRLSAREISRQTGMSKSGVLRFIHAFEKCEELDYPLPPGITNAGIAMKVYGKVPGEGRRDESYYLLHNVITKSCRAYPHNKMLEK